MEVNLKLVSGGNSVEVGSDIHCFLCWGTVSLVTQGDDNQVGDADVLVKNEVDKEETREEMEVDKQWESINPSLLAICRYLKLEVTRGPAFGKVTFCRNCEQVVGRLSELCRELELVKMKVLEELKTFDRILEAGMQLEEMRVAGDTGQEERINFKKKIKQESDAKINRTFPKVSILKQNIFRNLNSDIVSKFPTQHTQTSLKNNNLFPRPPSGFSSHARRPIGRNHKPCPHCGKWIHIKGHWRHINRVCNRKATQLEKPSVQEHLSDPLSLVDPLEAVEEPLEQKPTLPVQVPARFRLPFGSRLTKKAKLARCDLCGKQFSRKFLKRHKLLSCKLGPRLTDRWYNVRCTCDICGLEFKYKPNLYRHKRAGRCKGSFKQTRLSSVTSSVIQTENAEDPLQEPDCSVREQPPIVPTHSAPAKMQKIKCDLCGVMLHHTGLARHKKQVHHLKRISSKEKLPKKKCDLCGVELNPSGMWRHKKKYCKGDSTADPVRSYPGDSCGLEFQFPSNLNLHKEACHQEGATLVTSTIPEIRSPSAPPLQSEVKVEAAALMITGDIFDPDEAEAHP